MFLSKYVRTWACKFFKVFQMREVLSEIRNVDCNLEIYGLALNEVIELLDGFWLRNRIDWWSDDQF